MKRQTNAMAPGGPGVPAAVVQRDAQNPTPMGVHAGNPFVDERVTDPAARMYAQAMKARHAVPKYAEPVAGAPVAIPALDGEAIPGHTMSQHALAQRSGPPVPNLQGFSPMKGPAGIIQGDTHTVPSASKLPVMQVPGPKPGAIQLLPTDVLPDTAKADPAFQTGFGSMLASNQPDLARKYGVVRNGALVPPRALMPASNAPAFKQETIEGLQAIKDFQAQQASLTEQRVREEAEAGPAGGVAQDVNPPVTKEELEKLLGDLDAYEIDQLQRKLQKDILNNDEQRKIIEARCKEFDLSELIMTGAVAQVVPIIPGVFEPEFQSYTGEEDLTVKRLVGIEARSRQAGDRYVLDMYSLMGLTVALRAVNKQPLPDHRNEVGEFDEERFQTKYAIVSRFNYHMLSSMLVNWFWFDMRVRKLFRTESLGNG